MSNTLTPALAETLRPRAALTKFVFFDVDGTLVNSAHQVSVATREAIAQLAQSGKKFGLASGRPYFGAKWLHRELRIPGPSVLFSGALIVDPVTNTSLLEQALTRDEVLQVLDYARQEKLFVELYTKDRYVISAPSPFAEIHATYLGMRPEIDNLEKVAARETILKLEFCSASVEEEQKLRHLMNEIPGFGFGLGYGAGHPHVAFLNVTSMKATRENAFSFLLAHLQLQDSEIMAFGDAEADVPFLRLAGIGVAMGNAPVHVRNSAHVVTRSVEEDGVAYALSLLGLSPPRIP